MRSKWRKAAIRVQRLLGLVPLREVVPGATPAGQRVELGVIPSRRPAIAHDRHGLPPVVGIEPVQLAQIDPGPAPVGRTDDFSQQPRRPMIVIEIVPDLLGVQFCNHHHSVSRC